MTTSVRGARREKVRALYERLPYPPPQEDLDGFRDGRLTLDGAPRHYGRLYWPGDAPRDDLDILVAGCGTSQAAKFALLHPESRVVGIDLSETSLGHTAQLVEKYGIENLELRRHPIEEATRLEGRFDMIVSTGVLHHLPDPDAGLRALRDVLRPDGSMHLMVYATYGRSGVYMMQEYARRLRLRAQGADLAALHDVVERMSEHHPLRSFARQTDDLSTPAGLADALLHPQDRSFTVPQVHAWIERSGLRFMRWFLQAPYLPTCGWPARSPHAELLHRLPAPEQHAALELLRGTMITHTFAACRDDRPESEHAIDFGSGAWPAFVPSVFPGARVDPAAPTYDAAGVLRHAGHAGHADDDLALPLTTDEAQLAALVDGRRTIRDICELAGADAAAARVLFERLWHHDQVLIRTG